MKKNDWHYITLYAFIYAALGAISPFFGQHLRALGFSGTRIGIVTAGGTTVAILTAAFWGNRYGKSKNKKRFFLKLCLCAAIIPLALCFAKEFWIVLLFFCALHFFQAPILAFIDAMVIEDGQPFGAVRKWGAAGYAVGVFLTGKAVGLWDLTTIFLLYTAGFCVCAVILLHLLRKQRGLEIQAMRARPADVPVLSHTPSVPDSASAPVSDSAADSASAAPAPGSCAAAASDTPDSRAPGPATLTAHLLQLLSNKTYLKLLVCAFLLCGTTVANNVYFGFLLIQGGGTVAGIGFAFLLMAGSEVPFMAWSAKLAGRFTLEKTLLASMIVAAVRFAWYATGPPAAMLLGFFFLQGMVNGILLVEMVRYIAKVTEQEKLGLAVSVYYGAANLSAIVCQFLGGVILDFFGIGGVYLFFAAMNATGVALYVAQRLYKGS